jgi:hypothetical protein
MANEKGLGWRKAEAQCQQGEWENNEENEMSLLGWERAEAPTRKMRRAWDVEGQMHSTNEEIEKTMSKMRLAIWDGDRGTAPMRKMRNMRKNEKHEEK